MTNPEKGYTGRPLGRQGPIVTAFGRHPAVVQFQTLFEQVPKRRKINKNANLGPSEGLKASQAPHPFLPNPPLLAVLAADVPTEAGHTSGFRDIYWLLGWRRGKVITFTVCSKRVPKTYF